MEISDCKIIDAKIGHRDVKVLVQLVSPGFFGRDYVLKLQLTGDAPNDQDKIKGCYSLIKLAFDSFGKNEANLFAERVSKRNM